MNYSFKILSALADATATAEPLSLPPRNVHSFHMNWSGVVVSKERPRGKQHYTPKKTREFEKAVADAARLVRDKQYGGKRITWPVILKLAIYDPIPAKWPEWRKKIAIAGLVFPPVGDLDNKVKAVSDAFNNVVYDDDKLIVATDAFRMYGERAGFNAHLHPMVGLTSAELERLENIMKAKKNGHC